MQSRLGPQLWRSFIEPLRLACVHDDTAYLVAGNRYMAKWVREEALAMIQNHWCNCSDSKTSLALVTEDELPAAAKAMLTASDEATVQSVASKVGETVAAQLPQDAARTRTFETFVVGRSNELAFNAARRLAMGEASFVSILMLYGPQGYGKTHLLQAIRSARLAKNAKSKVVYLSAERFLSEFVRGMRSGDTSAFKEQIRCADLLAIDDVQTIVAGTRTYEEFCFTIRDFAAQGKQIVLSADAAPCELPGIDARVRTYLEGAVACPITEGDFDLRRGIIERKVAEIAAQSPGFELSVAVIDLIAARLTGSGRQLEGAVSKLYFALWLCDQPIVPSSVLSALNDELKMIDRKPQMGQVLKTVGDFYKVSVDDLVSSSRRRTVTRPRQAAMWLCRKLSQRSYPEIATKFGGRDHTTAMHAVRVVEERRLEDPQLATELQELTRRLRDAPQRL